MAQNDLVWSAGLGFTQCVSKENPKNFDQNLTDDQLHGILMKMEATGLRMLIHYAQVIPKDEAACRRQFEFGNKMGEETFMCEPNAGQPDLLDKLAKRIEFFNETTLKLAAAPPNNP